MTQNAFLKNIERNAYRSTFQDGLYDISWGLLVTGLALSPLLSGAGIQRPWNLFILVMPSLIVLWAGKKFMTIPRMGIVKFGAERKAGKRKQLKYLTAFSLLTVILVILTRTGSIPPGWGSGFGEYLRVLALGLILVMAPVSILAYFADSPRLYFIGALLVMSWPLAEFLYNYTGAPLDGIIAFGSSGGIILIIGFTLFLRFLRKYPLPIKEV